MPTPRNSSILRTTSLLLIVASFCSIACGGVIYVDDDGQADSATIQGGIDAAEYGDTVSVAPGVYFENVVLRSGINLIGAGAGATIIDAGGYGDVVDARANDASISGFTLRNSGEFDLGHMNCGVYCRGDYAPIVENNVITGNRFGVGLWDEADLVVRNNVIENNFGGLYIYGSAEHPTNPTIANNTIANNQIDGMILRVMVSPSIIHNIISGHVNGINHNYVTGSPVISYNNLWDNDVNYLLDNSSDDTLAGPGSLSVDPLFADSANGDYHLKSEAGRWNPAANDWLIDDITSPCIDAGDPDRPVGPEPIPNGSRTNIGAYGGTAEASKSPSLDLHDKYGGGAGEPNDPYLIYTPEDLNALGAEPNDYDKHLKLMADIDLSGHVYDRAVIAPDTNDLEDGFQGATFAGVFDGNGHAIRNMRIRGGSYLGLFGLRSGHECVISNLGMEAVDVNGTGDYVGGLVGTNGLPRGAYGVLTNCYITGIVSGRDYVGGLVGWNGASITGCYGTGVVTGNYYVGGLVGENYMDDFSTRCSGMVTQSYSTGSVFGTSYVGGLVGQDLHGRATYCYSAGAVAGDESVGGLIGSFLRLPTTSFWDIETSGQTSNHTTGLTTAEMQIAATFLEAGWDVVDTTEDGPNEIWRMWDGYDYPRLAWEAGPNTPLVFVDIDDPGFYGQMSKYEVTNTQYCDFLNAALASGDITVNGTDVYGAGGSNSGEDYAGQLYYNCDGSGYTGYGATNGGAARISYDAGAFGVDDGFGNHPVTYVSWYGAMAFANYYGYYLPAEDQWQAVADYDGTYIYGCGQTIDPGIANYRPSEHPDGTMPVGSFGIYGYGMSDMAGNVWEWTSSSLGGNRVFRGGSLGSVESDCAVSIRGDGIPHAAYWDIGFRVCR